MEYLEERIGMKGSPDMTEISLFGRASAHLYSHGRLAAISGGDFGEGMRCAS